jgi:hypothetical protein
MKMEDNNFRFERWHLLLIITVDTFPKRMTSVRAADYVAIASHLTIENPISPLVCQIPCVSIIGTADPTALAPARKFRLCDATSKVALRFPFERIKEILEWKTTLSDASEVFRVPHSVDRAFDSFNNISWDRSLS